MHEIKLYIEFHWGKRRPKLNYLLNNKILTPSQITTVQKLKYQENSIITLNAELLKDNNFKLIMSDKTDDDIIFNTDEYVDHWIKIREFEINDIKFDVVMYKTCSFTHSMPDKWVEEMKLQGFDILPYYKSGTDIRLNGTWNIDFSLPVWEWCVNNY
jgi:hypothetical protein